jgi:predicted nuclease of predicted toxin-antitoxin system
VPIRILLDEHLSPTIAHQLATLGFDIVCARDRGLANRRVQDWQILDWCSEQQYAVCTMNAADYEREHERRRARNGSHCGILIVERWTTGEIYWAIRQYLESGAEPELLMNQVVYLSKAAPEFIAKSQDE